MRIEQRRCGRNRDHLADLSGIEPQVEPPVGPGLHHQAALENLLKARQFATKLIGAWLDGGKAELGRQTGFNKTTVLRILRTLEHHGWVSQPAPGRYRAAVRFSDDRAHRIGYSSRDDRLPFPHAVTASLVRCAAAHGVELLSFDNRGSRPQTIRNAQRMIREKVDVALVFQAESGTGPQLSSLFNESGTAMISIDMAVAGASYFGADNVDTHYPLDPPSPKVAK